MNIGAAMDARSGTDLVPLLVTHGQTHLEMKARPGLQVQNAIKMAKLVSPVLPTLTEMTSVNVFASRTGTETQNVLCIPVSVILNANTATDQQPVIVMYVHRTPSSTQSTSVNVKPDM